MLFINNLSKRVSFSCLRFKILGKSNVLSDRETSFFHIDLYIEARDVKQ